MLKTLHPLWLVAVVVSPLAPVAAQELAPLREALTLHAGFERGLKADFSRGDAEAYVSQGGSLQVAQWNEDVELAEGAGRHGNALRFTRKSRYWPAFKGENVLGYNADNWSATVSVWLRLDPDKDLEPGYCDPIQIVGNDGNKGFIFLEWSKDETPRFFRYAVRPLVHIWNPDNQPWDAIPVAKRPMVQVAKAPFSRDHWTHVVFTLENVNDKEQPSRGKLFIDGQHQGTIENWDLTFGWDPASVQLVLGAAYVGYMDDLAVFNRALTEAEITQLHQLPGGAGQLHR
jgi:hypothetical protein